MLKNAYLRIFMLFQCILSLFLTNKAHFSHVCMGANIRFLGIALGLSYLSHRFNTFMLMFEWPLTHLLSSFFFACIISVNLVYFLPKNISN